MRHEPQINDWDLVMSNHAKDRFRRYLEEQPHFCGRMMQAFGFLSDDFGFEVFDAAFRYTTKLIWFRHPESQIVILIKWEAFEGARCRVGRQAADVYLPPGATPLCLKPEFVLDQRSSNDDETTKIWCDIENLATDCRDKLGRFLERLSEN